MRKQKYLIRSNGATQRERFYAIARRYCAIMSNRESGNPRCKRCFEMRFCVHDKTTRPRFGCNGCVEMEGFYAECAALFTGEKILQRWRII